MKPLYLFRITLYIRTYAVLSTIDMKATMSYYFLSQRYERDYVLFIIVENDIIHASTDAIYATHHNP